MSMLFRVRIYERAMFDERTAVIAGNLHKDHDDRVMLGEKGAMELRGTQQS